MEEASSVVQAQASRGHLQVRAGSFARELVFDDILYSSMVADIRQRLVGALGISSDSLSISVVIGHCPWPLLDSDYLQPLQRDGVIQLAWRMRAPAEIYDIRHCREGDMRSLSTKTQANLPLEMFLLGLRRNPKAFTCIVPAEARAFMEEYDDAKDRATRRMVSEELFDFVQAWWLKGLVVESSKPAAAP